MPTLINIIFGILLTATVIATLPDWACLSLAFACFAVGFA